MSYVNKYTESATYSGGNLIFSLNDGLTYSVNIPVGTTPSLQQVTSIGATTSNNITLTGTNSIQSNNGNGYFYFNDVLNQTLIGRNNPISSSTYSRLNLSSSSALLQSSQGINNPRSINMDNSGIDISVQSSTSISKLYIDTSNVWIIGTSSFYKLPNKDGLSGQVLTTDGAGQASWATASTYSPSARLTAWDAYNTNGLLVQTSVTTWTGRTITGPAAGITITNGNGVSGNPTLVLSNDLSALEGLGSTGFAVRTATDTWSQRMLIGSNTIDVINGNGVSGNPTLQLSATSSVFRKGSGDQSIEAVLGGNTASGTASFVVGTNNVGIGYGDIVIGYNNTTINSGNQLQAIIGSIGSTIGTSSNSIIIGGYSNNISGVGNSFYCNIISGGLNNSIVGVLSGGANTISGGVSNTITSNNNSNTISGGGNNIISGGGNSIISGGINNIISGGGSNVISGGANNIISGGGNSIISGGSYNSARGDHNIISGGYKTTTTITYASGQGSSVLGLSRDSGTILGVMSTGDKYSHITGGVDCYIGVNGNITVNSTYNASIYSCQNSNIKQNSIFNNSLMIHTMLLNCNNVVINANNYNSNVRTGNVINSENCAIVNDSGSQIKNIQIINSDGTVIQNASNTTAIGCGSKTITESDIVYIGNEIVGGKVATTVLSSSLSNTSSTVYSNIISFNAKAGATYIIKLVGTYQTAATTTGIKIRMSGTAVANVTGYITGAITAATTATSLKATISSMTAELITTGVSAINTPHSIEGNIIVRCTTAGTVILQMASEVNGSAAQLNIGTAVIVERVV